MQTKFILSLIPLAMCLTPIGCEEATTTPPTTATKPTKATGSTKTAGATTPGATTPDSAFPKKLGEYKRKGLKTKKKAWGTAHSATYSNSGDELKVVVNDAPPEGREAWAAFFKDGKQFKGKPMAIDAKPGKVTMMVRVGKRFRVDFKTRTKSEEELRKAAQDFDFGAVRKLAGTP
jgi:hypothetical protein